MSSADYQFVSTDTEQLTAQLVAAYEQLSGVSVRPASPEKLFIQWVADVVGQERVMNNYTGSQNIPSRAEGENLDALGELFFQQGRPQAQAAVCTERFWISAPQKTVVPIPAGTRVTDASNGLFWETVSEAHLPIGALWVDVPLRCQTAGTIGNGYAIGQLNTLVDVFPFYGHCENITESGDGTDQATDRQYYELLRASQDAYSDAGAKGGYIYFAKQVSTAIADVVANSPSPGEVRLYVLMQDGQIAGGEVKQAVYAACNPDDVRPLTDHVQVADPERVGYDVEITYYVPSDSPKSLVEMGAAVQAAVSDYVAWQSAKLGRDINPSYLAGLLMQTGIKRFVIASPVFTALRDGQDDTVPQVAAVGDISIINGGYEDE